MLALLLTGCGSSSDFQVGPTQTGVVAGTVSSSLGGTLAGVSLVVTPTGGTAMPAVMSSSSGGYRVLNVPILSGGSGRIAVSGVPSNCTAPSAVSFTGLTAHDSLSVPITVPCTAVGGNLLVTVNASAGISDSVTVTGPGAFTRTLTVTTTLTGLTPGSYVVTARNGHASGAIVDASDSATVVGSPAVVVTGKTDTATVTYAPRPGIGLWVANSDGASAFEQFTGAQLAAGGSPTPSAVINAATPSAASDLAFDHAGNMWTVNAATSAISKYTASQLGTPGATPAVTISDASLSEVMAVTFDANGNLWLAAYGPCAILEYTASQLTAASGSASVAPALTLNGCGFDASLTGPASLAFDAAGNLWVGDVDNNVVYAYSATTLAASGAITSQPAVRITTTDNMKPAYLSFDATGNLWVTDGGARVIEFSAAQLVSGGSVTPVKTITTAGAVFEGLAFDNSGDLWVVDNSHGVVEFSTAQLASGGSLTPAISVNTAAGAAADMGWTIAFNPHASSIPLYNRVARIASTAKRR
jgi:ligand-binding sensor domain-containing protein